MEWRLNHVGQMAQSVQDYSMILYYHMTQCLDSGSSTYGISKNSGWGNGDLETFLKKFVAEAQYAKRVKNHLFSPS